MKNSSFSEQIIRPKATRKLIKGPPGYRKSYVFFSCYDVISSSVFVSVTPRQNVCACAHFVHFRFRAYVVHFHSVCFRTVRELNSQGWRSSPVRQEKFTLVCSRSPKKKTYNWSFHVVVLQRTEKKCTRMCNARAESFFCSLKPIVFRRSRCRRRGGCLNSLMPLQWRHANVNYRLS